jgi:hypothetical protein
MKTPLRLSLPSLISEILTKEPGSMRPARPNKTWAEDLPRSPFCYLSPRGCARLQTGEAPGHAKKGRLSLYSSTGANPLSAPHFQGLARWKVLIRWRRLPVGHLPCQLVLFFFSRASLRRSPECQQLHAVLWKTPIAAVESRCLESTNCTEDPSA